MWGEKVGKWEHSCTANSIKVGIALLQNNLAVLSEINIIPTTQQPRNPTTWFILLRNSHVHSQVEQRENLHCSDVYGGQLSGLAGRVDRKTLVSACSGELGNGADGLHSHSSMDVSQKLKVK